MADIGYGATLGVYNGSTYDTVANLISYSSPHYSRDAVETTHMLSANRFREFVPGLVNGGETTFGINFTPATSDALLAALLSNSLGQFKITFTNGVTCVFTGVPTDYQPAEPIDDRMTATFTVKVSGKPTWA